MSQAPSTFGIMITSSLSPISVTSVVMSSRHQGESSAFTRVQSAVAPRSISLPIFTRPARAGSLFSTVTASTRLPSTMSALAAVAGSLPTIFSLLGSKKWIIRDGVTGISITGSGAPTARGLTKSRGLRIGGLENTVPRPPNPVRHDLAHEHRNPCRRNRPGRPRGDRSPPLRALSRGVRGRRRLQALARQDGDRGRRPPVLPHHHEPPSAPHQRRLRRREPAGPQRRRGAARVLPRARHERLGRLGQGDRQSRHGGAEASRAGLPRGYAVLRVR